MQRWRYIPVYIPSAGSESTAEADFIKTMTPSPVPRVQLTVMPVVETEVKLTPEAWVDGSV